MENSSYHADALFERLSRGGEAAEMDSFVLKAAGKSSVGFRPGEFGLRY